MLANSSVKERVLTGAALAVPALALLLVGGKFLTLFAVALYFVANYEFFSVVSRNNSSVKYFLFLLSAFPPLGFFFNNWQGFATGLLSSTLGACIYLVLSHRTKKPTFENVFPAFAGLIVPILLGSSLYLVSAHAQSSPFVLWLVLGVVASDTFAYFGGRYFQGAKLAPGLSPNKTVSGAISGFAGAMFVLVSFAYILRLPVVSSELIAASISIALLAPLGDLLGSLIKRMYDAKDYGSVLPGHGGILDRVVALLFAAPVVLFLS